MLRHQAGVLLLRPGMPEEHVDCWDSLFVCFYCCDQQS